MKHAGSRRIARELTVQFLYQQELTKGETKEALALFWRTQADASSAARDFANKLIAGVFHHIEEIDEKIKKYTEHWELSRIAAVDRNILRLAMYEMLFRTDIPPIVSINEAVEIAKRFSTKESGAFVNGILDRLRIDLPRPARTASSGE